MPEATARTRTDSKVSVEDPEPAENVPSFSEDEDDDDYGDDSELMCDVIARKPGQQFGLGACIIVDGLPVVGPEKAEKLRSVVQKQMQSYGTVKNAQFPQGEDQHTLGYAFIEYEDEDQAQKAIQGHSNYKFDKAHVLTVDSLAKYDDFVKEREDDATELKERPYKEAGNLRHWLEDEEGTDQYLLLSNGGAVLSVYNNERSQPTLLEERENWTESGARWSPQGSYLLTMHSKGIALWGWSGRRDSDDRARFEQVARFVHRNVVEAIFSPDERFLLTCQNLEPGAQLLQEAVVVWDAVTATKIRSFSYTGSERHRKFSKLYKWSHDGKYLAYLEKDQILIYEADTSFVIGTNRKPVKAPSVQEMGWAPSKRNLLAYWTAEDVKANRAATLGLFDAGTHAEARQRPVQSVVNCDFAWQAQGDYLCFRVDRYRHKKEEKGEIIYTGKYYNLEIFRIKEKSKEIPVESIQMNEVIHQISWEPNGSLLCVAHQQPEGKSGSCINFFASKPGKNYESKKKFNEQKEVNFITWAPQGQFMVACHLAQKTSNMGRMVFIDTADSMQIMNAYDCNNLSAVDVDPSGRFVAASILHSTSKMDNEYSIYTIVGRKLRKVTVQSLLKFQWRPRPPTLLPNEKVEKVKKNLKKYVTQFEELDKQRESRVSKELLEKRREMMMMFWDMFLEEEKLYESSEQKKRRKALREGVDTDLRPDQLEQEDFVEETVEVVIFTRKEEIRGEAPTVSSGAVNDE